MCGDETGPCCSVSQTTLEQVFVRFAAKQNEETHAAGDDVNVDDPLSFVSFRFVSFRFVSFNSRLNGGFATEVK